MKPALIEPYPLALAVFTLYANRVITQADATNRLLEIIADLNKDKAFDLAQRVESLLRFV